MTRVTPLERSAPPANTDARLSFFLHRPPRRSASVRLSLRGRAEAGAFEGLAQVAAGFQQAAEGLERGAVEARAR